MAFQVDLSAQASRHIEEIYEWLQEKNPTVADRWFNGVMFTIHTLKDSPQRCSKIPEQDSFTLEIRHLIYQKNTGLFSLSRVKQFMCWPFVIPQESL